MHGNHVERLLLMIESVLTTITDFTDVNCISCLSGISKNYDAALGKINLIEKNTYMNDRMRQETVGSPYTELYRLRNALYDVAKIRGKELDTIHTYFQLSRVHQLALDAKWALSSNGESIEGGYQYIQSPGTTR